MSWKMLPDGVPFNLSSDSARAEQLTFNIYSRKEWSNQLTIFN